MEDHSQQTSREGTDTSLSLHLWVSGSVQHLAFFFFFFSSATSSHATAKQAAADGAVRLLAEQSLSIQLDLVFCVLVLEETSKFFLWKYEYQNQVPKEFYF